MSGLPDWLTRSPWAVAADDDDDDDDETPEPEPEPEPEAVPDAGFDLVEFLADEDVMFKVGWLRQTFADLKGTQTRELVMPPPIEIPEMGDGSINVKEYEAQREASLSDWRKEPIADTPSAAIPRVSSGELLQEAVSFLDPDAGFDFDAWMEDRVGNHTVVAFFSDYLRYGSESYGYPFIDMAYNCLKVHEKELVAPRPYFTS